MSEDRWLNVFKVLTGIWTVFILTLLTIPVNSIEKIESIDVPGLDKLIHFILFVVLNALALKTIKRANFIQRKDYIFFMICGFAIFTECIQLFLSDRSFDIFDIIANIMGALAARVIFIKNLN